MDIRELRCLVTVVECSSYSKAADRLFVSRQAVTKAVANLEAELGVKLVRRQGLGVAPTHQGALVARDARKVVEAFDDFRDAHPGAVQLAYSSELRELPRDVTASRDAAAGRGTTAARTAAPARGASVRRQARGASVRRQARETLLVALVTGGSRGLPPGLLDRFTRAHPSVHLAITEASADEVIDMVIRRDAQIGIVGSHARLLVGLDSKLIMAQGLWLYVPRDNPLSHRTSLSIADLDGQPMVTAGSRNHLHQFLVGACREQGIVPNIRATAEGAGALVSLARENGALFFGFNPANAAAQEKSEPHGTEFVCIKLDVEDGDAFGTYEVRLAGAPASRAARHFWDMAGAV